MNCKISPGCKLAEYVYDKNKIQIKGLQASGKTSNKKSKILVVFKQPDKFDSEYLGKGRNVEKFQELISKASISPNDVYMTSLVKCYPPKRSPSVQEIKACMAHLSNELKAVDPEVIVLMGGDPSLRAFNLTGLGGIKAIHGTVFNKKFPHDKTLDKEYKIIVSYDPNALFMSPDPKLELTIVNDLKVAKNAANCLPITYTETKCNYQLVQSLDQLDRVIEKIQQKKFFAFDTETRGLAWYDEPMIMTQVCWGYGSVEAETAIIPFYFHDPNGTDWKLKPVWSNEYRKKVVEKLKVIFEDPNITKSAHNFSFDANVLRRHTGIRVKGFFFDSLLQHYILHEYPPHDLEYLADLEFGVGNYSKELKDIVGRGKVTKTWDIIPDNIFHPYAAMDAECTYRLTKLYYDRIASIPHLWKLYCEEVEPLLKTFIRSEWHGVLLDKNIIDNLSKEFVQERKDITKELRRITNPEFNPGSPEQVAEEITKAGYGSFIKDRSKTLGFNTSKKILNRLEEHLPWAEKVLRYRSLDKLIGTYLENAKNDTNSDGRIRIGMRIHGTVSGRPSCNFLHQIPRLDEERLEKGLHNMRDMFIAPDGFDLVYGDFSQIELVVLAIRSGDKEMLDIFRSGEDIHKFTSAAFLGFKDTEVNSFNRSVGKAINFGRVYGSEGSELEKLQFQDRDGKLRPLTSDLIRRGFRALDKRFPAAAKYFEDTVTNVRLNGGEWISPFGRMRRMGILLNDQNQWARKESERSLVNCTLQGPASSVTIRTLNAVEEMIIESVLKGILTEEEAFLLLTVHDSGLWQTKEEKSNWFSEELKRIATRKIPELDNFSFTMKIGKGKSWTEAELNAK